MEWQTSRFRMDLAQPHIMAIVNVTPDSFSDGGRHDTTAAALAHCEQLLNEGADILDIGGESTRPGSPAVGLEDELARVLPVVREAVKLGVPISVDTYKPRVMQAVLDAGADIVNDVWALRMPGALDALAVHPKCGVCLMHMHRDPQSMQVQPMDGDVVPAVLAFLKQRVQVLQQRGVARERITVDPGIGFGKTPQQNFSLLARQAELLVLGVPVLAGWSRKSSLGWATGSELPSERLFASLAAALIAVERGARIVRVHDVKETRQALQVWEAQNQ
ncbi:dihydropteroate synthase [Hydrogenophaga sp. PAMC20947]|uniref:dihydropteroate synthase n=1 Tax=Hydrogenophaga sp. PAMC20947 TaxID=2565558 RepID=UPI00109DE39B|nr:dihydropteroate synthase [Hydrogenophaga sp. PAMC20947]QCB45671.1 dihydropteroate synthase [Hydrogenophaga sp. PAMC20947]